MFATRLRGATKLVHSPPPPPNVSEKICRVQGIIVTSRFQGLVAIKLSTDYAVTSGLGLVLVIGRESLREAVVGNPLARFIPRYPLSLFFFGFYHHSTSVFPCIASECDAHLREMRWLGWPRHSSSGKSLSRAIVFFFSGVGVWAARADSRAGPFPTV